MQTTVYILSMCVLPFPSPLQTLREMDRLSVEETRDLLVSVMFVLKHLDNGSYCTCMYIHAVTNTNTCIQTYYSVQCICKCMRKQGKCIHPKQPVKTKKTSCLGRDWNM